MPGLTRSAQSLIPFGLPFRVAMTTTESVTMPLYWLLLQAAATLPAFTRRVMAGSSENPTMSAFCPATTARLWSPEAPYDWLNSMFWPASVFWNAAMIFSYAACGVEYATSANLTLGLLLLVAAFDAPPQPATAIATALSAAAPATIPRWVFMTLLICCGQHLTNQSRVVQLSLSGQ